MTGNVCFYHANCDDGFAAAYVIWLAMQDDCDYLPAQYNTPLPEYNLAGKHVIFVDLSVPPDELVRISSIAETVTILDHHKTAIAAYDGFDLPENCVVKFDMSRSGAMMAWNFIFMDAEPPLLIKHIQDRDLWKFEIPNTREFTEWFRIQNRDFPTMRQSVSLMNDMPEVAYATGTTLLAEKREKINLIVKTKSELIDFQGHEEVAFAVSENSFVSDLGNALLDHYPDAPFAVIEVAHSDGFTYSLRSTDDRVDVSEIAKANGGAGHRNAAGFRKPSPT